MDPFSINNLIRTSSWWLIIVSVILVSFKPEINTMILIGMNAVAFILYAFIKEHIKSDLILANAPFILFVFYICRFVYKYGQIESAENIFNTLATMIVSFVVAISISMIIINTKKNIKKRNDFDKPFQ